MDTKKYHWVFYFIAVTIVATIAIQFYWNYKNYEENKRQVTNEIQLSLDNAIEEYFSSLAKSNFLTIVEAKDFKIIDNLNQTENHKKPKFTINNIRITSDENLSKEKVDSMMNSTKEFVSKLNSKKDSLSYTTEKKKTDSVKLFTKITDLKNRYNLKSDGSKTEIKYFKGKKAADSLKLIDNLKPIFISFLDQTIQYQKIDSLIDDELFDDRSEFYDVEVRLLSDFISKCWIEAKSFTKINAIGILVESTSVGETYSLDENKVLINYDDNPIY